MFAARNMLFAKASAFNPLSLSPALWLSDTGSDAGVWPDISGNGRHATQATAANQPSIVTGALNGRQVRRFDGIDDWMSCYFKTFPSTAFFVLRGHTNAMLDTAPEAPNTLRFFNYNNLSDLDFLDCWNKSPSFALSNTTSTRLISVVGDYVTSRSVQCFQNGLSVASQGTPSTSNIAVTAESKIGNINNGLSWFSGDIAEILVFPTALSLSQRQQVEKWLGAKWGIPVPSDDEYFIQSLSPALWLDASDASTLYDATTGGSLVAADGAIARWEDKTGNSQHATQATSGYRPLRKTAVQNGKDVVRFDGIDDLIGGSISVGSITEYSVFIVSKKTASRTQATFTHGDSGSNGYAAFDYLGNRVILHGGRGRITDGAWPSNAWEAWSAVRSGGTVTLKVNGSTQSMSGSTTLFSSPSNIYFVASDSSFNVFQGDIAEILVFPTALSTADRQAVEAYLNAKWAIY